MRLDSCFFSALQAAEVLSEDYACFVFGVFFVQRYNSPTVLLPK